mgnify:CR=1 FL=1
MSLKENFGKRIKLLREAAMLTQEDFAESVGIHRNTLARIEGGENFVSTDTLEDIAKALNVEVYELFMFNQTQKQDTIKALKLNLEELNENELKYFINIIKSKYEKQTL